MENFLAIGTLIGFIAFFVSIWYLFRWILTNKNNKAKFKKRFFISIVLFFFGIISSILLGIQLNQEALNSGFKSVAEYEAARENNISDPKIWEQYKANLMKIETQKIEKEHGNNDKEIIAVNPDSSFEKIRIPSDPKASYYLIDQIVRKSGLIEITTKRDGPSGKSYAIRLVQCSPLRFGYIADGGNLNKLKRDDAHKMSALVEGSISDVISRYACNKSKHETQKKVVETAPEPNDEINIYLEQLDREIASIPNIKISTYTKDVNSINLALILFGAWALIYEEGEKFILEESVVLKREKYKRLLINTQKKMLPKLRDSYGPAMRKKLWETDGYARTIGKGFRTVEFVSVAFSRNANIKQIHNQIRETLLMLRFTRAQYKWSKLASEFSFYTLEPPKDNAIVKWEGGGLYHVLE